MNFADKCLKYLRLISFVNTAIINGILFTTNTSCLGQSQDECPRCSPERRIMQEMIHSQRLSSSDHSEFLKNVIFLSNFSLNHLLIYSLTLWIVTQRIYLAMNCKKLYFSFRKTDCLSLDLFKICCTVPS